MKSENCKKRKISNFIIILIIYLFIFQRYLETRITLFKYFDEMVAICGMLVLVINVAKKKFYVNKHLLKIFIGLSIITSLGLFANIKYKYQKPIYAIVDWLLVMKFFCAYYLGYDLSCKIEIDKKQSNVIDRSLKMIVVFFLICTILNYAFKIWPNSSYRFGIMSNQIFYGHPTNLAAACILILALRIMIANKIIDKYNIIIIFISLTTLRAKAIGAVLITIVLMLYMKNSNKKISLGKIILICIIALIIGFDQISYYYVNMKNSARNMLTKVSFEIANEYFPTGTGFGTYGSAESGGTDSYSAVYYMYGLNNIWGLGYGKTFFLSDTFWPTIIGEFGHIGCIVYIILLVLIFKRIQNGYDEKKKNIYISKLICLVYLLISSTSESAFFHPMAVPLAIILGI